MPRWMALLLLCVAVWLGVRMVDNVTDTLTAIAGSRSAG